MNIITLIELIEKAGVGISTGEFKSSTEVDVETALQEENYRLRKEIERIKLDKSRPEFWVVEHEHGECEDYYYRNEIFLSRAEAEAGFDERIKVAREDTWDDKIYLHKGGEDEHGRIVPVGKPLIEAKFSNGY